MSGHAGMDGWRRMGLDDAFQIRQVLSLGLVQTRFSSWARFLYSRYNEYVSIKPFLNIQLSFTPLCFMARVPYRHHTLINKYIYCPQGG
jgi:hypothetical protein